MGIKDFMLKNGLVPAVVKFSGLIAVFLFFLIVTGRLFDLFKEIPLHMYALFLLLVTGLLVTVLTKKRFDEIKLYNNSVNTFGIATSVYGLEKICEFPYEHVIWIIQSPKSPPWGSSSYNLSLEDIEVSIPPRCPECKTELEQKAHFWGSFGWTCVDCGFKCQSKQEWYRVAERVKKIVKRKFEQEMEFERRIRMY